MKWLWNFALARAREPSTWRGIVMLIAGSWAMAHREQAEAIIALGVTLAGLLGAFTADAPLPEPPLDPPPGELRDPAGEPDTGHVRALPGRDSGNGEASPPGPFGF